MNEQVQELVDVTRETLGLTSHQLKRYHFFRETNHFNETIYIMNMEWSPNNSEAPDEDINAAGTAVVDVNFHTQEVRRIVFVQDVNTADNSVYPSSAAKEHVIEWIEEMTELTFGRQFLIAHEEEQALSFSAAVDNIPVSPTGTIEVAFNDDGELILFSVDGVFPNEEQIEWEPFALTPDKYEPVAKEQCQLLQLPDQEQEKWLPIYGIEEVFITNDAERTITFSLGAGRNSFVAEDKILRWDEPLEGEFEWKEMDFSPEVSLETVLEKEPHPDTIPLTNAEVEACEKEVLRFMRLVYSDESGKRKLTGIYLQNGYVIAEIKHAEDEVKRALDIKIKLVIERDTLTAMNYIDQDRLFQAFNHFGNADEVVVSQEDAFDKLREHLEIDPVYVYDSEREHYIMCGKLDCAYGVNAVTGEVVALNAL
ncbi:hypothetical protein FH966_03750 [Lentibacillus cibarius]|uniref:DUF4901 domain-containing protein n=1 Tax=Lentibacillus cibarius TaxID=2583219 RepID=A0A549YG92_9BACI|nr:hypothetical protein [Lentibacillus cibarius]TRM10904.1 hypothetical protein FH966_03750 [Lentibacillus cibarius]